ncbi:MAG: FtsX-like permease family protein [Candidatus Thermoplasmatota archaeon]|nr:FtsX-like permease family protein [Candidatus Thermoplasmatota archaeon]
MKTTLLSKSFRDLKQRKARSVFTILTIMLGVAALGMFGVMPLVDQAMQDEIRDSNMHDVLLRFNDTELDHDILGSLDDLDNVRSSEAMFILYTRIYIGERRNIAWVVGVPDLRNMSVDRISIEKGHAPTAGNGGLLMERSNIDLDLLSSGIDSQVRMYDSSGDIREMNIMGIAHNPYFSGKPFEQIAMFYTDLETVHDLANASGYNMLSIDLIGSGNDKALGTIEDVNTTLTDRTDFTGFTQLPQIRQPGDWQLKKLLESVGSLFNVIAYLVLFCGLFLIANTMHTMITEQRREIAQMKAIGATGPQVGRSYLTTSLIMGVIGSLLGTILGLFITIGMAGMFGSMVGIRVGFDVHLPTVLIGFLTGCTVTVLASTPALLIALRIRIREGMEGCGISSSYGSSFMDRLLVRTGFKTVPMVAQMGLRNSSRRKGRSVSTILQVALAVGMLLGVITSVVAMADEIDREYSSITYDIQTTCQEEGANPLTESVGSIIGSIPGVLLAEPYLSTMIGLDDYDTIALGYVHDTESIDLDLAICSGRWFTKEEEDQNAHVILLNKRLAASIGAEVGDSVMVRTRAGTFPFEVVGIGIQVYQEAYIPLKTVQDIMGYDGIVSGFNIFTESKDHSEIDLVATLIEDNLVARDYLVNNQIWYITSKQVTRGADTTEIMMIASGALIVFVTMIGLMSMLTMNIIERTREIGILRCIGSSTASILSVFGMEGLVIALLGWVVGLPAGYLVQIILTHSITSSSGMEIPYIFPLKFVLLSIVVTIAVTVLIIQPSLWRAGRLRPGEALRYQ